MEPWVNRMAQQTHDAEVKSRLAKDAVWDYDEEGRLITPMNRAGRRALAKRQRRKK